MLLVKSTESEFFGFFSKIFKTSLEDILRFSGFFPEISERPLCPHFKWSKYGYISGDTEVGRGGREESFKGGLPYLIENQFQ
jgi:hypothetical protein